MDLRCSDMERNKVRVTIAGVNYSLITDETAEYTNEIAAEIDSKMKELQGANPFMSANQAAVLVAIEFADKARKSEQTAEGYRAQIKDYLACTFKSVVWQTRRWRRKSPSVTPLP